MTSPINRGGASAIPFQSNNEEPKKEANTATAPSSSSSSSIAPAVQAEDETRRYLALNMDALKELKSANQFYDDESYESAIEAAEKGLRSQPTNKLVLCRLSLVLANSYNKMRNYDKAIETVNNTLNVLEDLSPEHYKQLLFKFGTALVYAKNKQKKYEEVTEICISFLKKSTSKGGAVYDDDHYTIDLFVQYAKALFHLKEYEEAAAPFEEINLIVDVKKDKPNFSSNATRFLGSYFMLSCTTFYALKKYESVLNAVNVGLSMHEAYLKTGGSSFFKSNELTNIKTYFKAAQDKLKTQSNLDDVD